MTEADQEVRSSLSRGAKIGKAVVLDAGLFLWPIAGRPSREIGGHLGESTLKRLLPATTIYMEAQGPVVLTRRPGESVLIDNPIAGAEPITVTVLGVKGNQIRIGIDAPTDITILREELVSESA